MTDHTTEKDQSKVIEVMWLLLGDGIVTGSDGEWHGIEVSSDGDGWNEPYSEGVECVCGQWSTSWVQVDRACSDRPRAEEYVRDWMRHVWPEQEQALPPAEHRPNACCDHHRFIADGCCHCEQAGGTDD